MGQNYDIWPFIKIRHNNFSPEMAGKLSSIRNEYSKAKLNKKQVDPDPIAQLHTWVEEAVKAKVGEPTAMFIATTGKDLRPSSRIVLLKEVVDGKLVFYTNYESRKGRQLEENPFISATLFWKELERQIHIEGKVEKVPTEMSDEYFNSRPWKSRIGARISPQSQEIESRNTIKRAFAKETLVTTLKGVKRPDNWGGYFIIPDRIEFWQGRKNRLHDRILFTKEGDHSWKIVRLAP